MIEFKDTNSLVTMVIATITVLAMPVLGFYQVFGKYHLIDEKNHREKYKIFLEDHKVGTRMKAIYVVIYLVRRLLFVGVLIFMDGLPLF